MSAGRCTWKAVGRSVGAASIFVCLTACANRPSAVAVGAIKPDASIGIVASIPPELRIESGSAFSGLHVDLVDVTQWRLSALAADAAMRTLSTRYKIVPTTVSGYIVDTDVKLEKAFNETRAIETQTRDRVHVDGSVDYLLVICYGNAAQPYRPGAADMVAVGVKKMYTVWNRPPVLHTYLQVSLLDGKTDRVIATEPLAIASHSFAFGDEPVEALDGFEWHENWSEMAPEQQKLIEDHVKQMLEQAIPYTLKEMKIAS
jgi:hypothetical protein